MWPKALLELLPHLTRFVPLANNFFQSRASGDEALCTAIDRKLDAQTASLRVDLERAGEANAAVLGQLTRHTAALAQAAADLSALKLAGEALEARLAKSEQRYARNSWLFVVLALQSLAVCLLIALLVFLRLK